METSMPKSGRYLWLTVGLIYGAAVAGLLAGRAKPARADNDRYEDYVMCTGEVTADVKTKTLWNPVTKKYHIHREEIPVEGVWLLDYRSGKLLGTVVDRTVGKVVGWAEVDLVSEFAITPRQNVHFTMTTGVVGPGQAALYIAETTTGQLAVYTMGPRPDGGPGIVIRRHDRVPFRKTAK
jgi:hypothetical protein